MGVTRASACAKAILLGEHAVVYGQPAIAVPIVSRRAEALVCDAAPGSAGAIVASDLGVRYPRGRSYVDDHGQFLWAAAEGALRACLGEGPWPALEIVVRSTIPIASGMGSGAAVSAAIARGIAAHFCVSLSRERLSELVYATECLLHGTPSGIDNTVVAFESAVWFRRGQGAQPLALGAPLALVMGDTGIPSRTRESVALVRRRWQAQPAPLEALFEAIGATVCQARAALAAGDLPALGRLLDRNQELLQELGVSDPALERLIAAARRAGALGAKLSGGGMGGCMVALATPAGADGVLRALREAGAADVILARLEQSGGAVV